MDTGGGGLFLLSSSSLIFSMAACSSYQVPVWLSAEIDIPVRGFKRTMPSP